MTTVSDFLRWIRDESQVNPQITNYELVLANGPVNAPVVREFAADHLSREVIIFSDDVDNLPAADEDEWDEPNDN